jgi:hypothetical protein
MKPALLHKNNHGLDDQYGSCVAWGCAVLAAQSLLTEEQGSLLQTLAWQQDFALLKAYKEVRQRRGGKSHVERFSLL